MRSAALLSSPQLESYRPHHSAASVVESQGLGLDARNQTPEWDAKREFKMKTRIETAGAFFAALRDRDLDSALAAMPLICEKMAKW